MVKICIVGLGYVGLPLAIQFARSGAEVIGLDVDRAKVDQVNRGRSYIKHIAAKTISEVLKAKRLTRVNGLQPDQKSRCSDYLRADTAE